MELLIRLRHKDSAGDRSPRRLFDLIPPSARSPVPKLLVSPLRVRLQGNDPESSLDLTQAYFSEILEKDYLKDVDPSLGRFRAFLTLRMS